MPEGFVFKNLLSFPSLAIIFAILVALFAISYHKTQKPISGKTKKILVLLRSVAVLMLIIVLLGPIVQTTTTIREKHVVAFLFDTSKSMTLNKDSGYFGDKKDIARSTAIRDMLYDNGAVLNELESMYDVQKYIFSEESQPIKTFDDYPEKPSESGETRLGDAISALLAANKDRQVKDIIIVSDGVNTEGTPPEDLLPECEARSVALDSVGFGSIHRSESFKDIAVVTKELQCAQYIVQKNTLTIPVDLQFYNLAGQTVTVRLKIDNNEIKEAAQQVKIKDPSEERTLTFLWTAEFSKEGLKSELRSVSVEADIFPDEKKKDNNAGFANVKIMESGLNVLYIEGAMRPEYKYLRRALMESPDIQFTTLLHLWKDQPNPFPKTKAEWAKYHVIIMGDIPSDTFYDPKTRSYPQLQQLYDSVTETKGGFIMLGGFQTLGPGGYAKTPIANLIPVSVAPTNANVLENFKLVRTPKGKRHYALTLGITDPENDKIWETLPTLDGYMDISGLKGAAQVLLTAEGTNVKDKPILVAFEGAWRSMVFLNQTTHKWAFSIPRETAEQKTADQFAPEHRRFWRQLIFWLAYHDQKGEDTFWLELDKSMLRRRGEKVTLTGRVRDAKSQHVSGTVIKADIYYKKSFDAEPKLEKSIQLIEKTDLYESDFKPEKEGIYEIKAAATLPGRAKTLNDKAGFILDIPNLERDQELADYAMLKRLSDNTGGSFYEPVNFKELLAKLKDDPKKEFMVERKDDPITWWDNWIVFLIFTAALALEWIIRKRAGLV